MSNCTELRITRQKVNTVSLLLYTVVGLVLILSSITMLCVLLPQANNSTTSGVARLLVHPKSMSILKWMVLVMPCFFALLLGFYFISIWRFLFKGKSTIFLKKNNDESTIFVRENKKLLKKLPLHLIAEVYIQRTQSIGIGYSLEVVGFDGNTLFSLDLTPIVKGEVAHNDMNRMVEFLRAHIEEE